MTTIIDDSSISYNSYHTMNTIKTQNLNQRTINTSNFRSSNTTSYFNHTSKTILKCRKNKTKPKIISVKSFPSLQTIQHKHMSKNTTKNLSQTPTILPINCNCNTSTKYSSKLIKNINRNTNTTPLTTTTTIETIKDNTTHHSLINNNCQSITNEAYESVLEHTKQAWLKDFHSIINKHEPQVIHHRNKIYQQAISNGITSHSPIALRLPYIQSVIEYTFESVEPPNKYTANTDRKHFKEVANLALQFYKQSLLENEWQNLNNFQKVLGKQQKRFSKKTSETFSKNISTSTSYKIPLTLIISSWCHDIERFLPCTKCKYLDESVDHYRKQIIHPITSARICCEVLLANAPITEYEIERIKQMILHHDMPYPLRDICVNGKCLVAGVRDQLLMNELQFLMDADSFAFFQSTLGLFIEYKRKKCSGEFIWKRVLCNVLRLRPHLRVKAVEAIEALPVGLREMMVIDYGELEEAVG